MTISTDTIKDLLNQHQLDSARYEEVERNHQQVVQLLKQTRYDGLLVTEPDNFAWLTAGGDPSFGHQQSLTESGLFLNETGRIVLTLDTVSPQLFDCEISALGFQLKERLWSEGFDDLGDEICRGRAVMSDSGFGRTRAAGKQLSSLRANHSPYVVKKYKQLVQKMNEVFDQVSNEVESGVTEREVGQNLFASLVGAEIAPVRVQVYADNAHQMYPHWNFDETPARNLLTIHAVGRWRGLHAAVTKQIDLTEPDDALVQSRDRATRLLEEVVDVFRSGAALKEVWENVSSACEREPGSTEMPLPVSAIEMGYRYPETILSGHAEGELQPNRCWFWQFRLGSAIIGQMLMTQADGPAQIIS